MYMNYILDIRIKRSYEWLEKQHERFDLMGAINARYEIPEIKFNGLDSLNCSMDTETQSLRYSDTMSTREHTPRNYLDSDIGVYASDDMSSAWSEESDAETEESYDPTQLSYKNQTYLTVPKMNGKFHHSAINRGFVLESYAKSPRLNGVVNGGVPPPTQKLVTTISGDVIKDEDIKSPSLSQHTSKIDNQTYILATDADMKFDADSILEVLTACNSDMRLGGACGRTHPVGNKNNPIVWFQMFEYAKGKIFTATCYLHQHCIQGRCKQWKVLLLVIQNRKKKFIFESISLTFFIFSEIFQSINVSLVNFLELNICTVVNNELSSVCNNILLSLLSSKIVNVATLTISLVGIRLISLLSIFVVRFTTKKKKIL